MSYMLTPRATSAPFMPIVVALVGAATKTVLQIGVPSTTDIRIIGWGISFDGVTSTAVPVQAQLAATDVFASGLTAATPELWSHDQETAALSVGGAALSGHGGGVTPTEGTITSIRVFDQQLIHPQSGYSVIWPESDRIRVQVSRAVRIRCLAAAAVNVIPWIIFNEPNQ